MLQAILIGLVAALGVFGDQLGSLYINRPIILGPIVGLILGDVQQGVIIGATLELFFMGAVSIGAYIPPDVIVGGTLATAFAISMGSGTEAAIALAMPLALISLAIGNIFNVVNSFILRIADKSAEAGSVGGIKTAHWGIGMITVVRRFLLVCLGFYFGAEAMSNVIASIPEQIIAGMDAAAGLLPALGFAMLMRMILNKKLVPFYFLGFVLSAYLNVPVLGIAIIGVIIVIEKFDFLGGFRQAPAGLNVEDDDDDF
ncbi:PTS sugar transporter subunit IIC [Erysipelothrix enhydrae]|uniref:PTS mannose/fructose/sorbose/N-acetylgalactosamine transporter subunit IIC n=1 Tax=Erysipelothrix enhydrae TaxID=2890314 RepID=UPI002B2426E4|nr:PTS sugar transporter subunit IIC [Erysipelothrix sp. 4322-04]WRB87329.1 PTS sugar transporter subunit IIC [Erysipelothrix sp. 4322-04]